jgi:hypothetical protein
MVDEMPGAATFCGSYAAVVVLGDSLGEIFCVAVVIAAGGLTRENVDVERHGEMVGLGRLELPTSPLSGVRSSHLSYRPKLEDSDYNNFTGLPDL